MNQEITIRRAETSADFRACQEAQRRAWGLQEDSYVVPIATMAGAQLHGGLVLGAFLPDGSAVGVSFAFLGRTEGRVCLYSQLTGVVPGYQSQGIGRRLKSAQHDFARAEQIPCVAWAFDPLQAGNARFNLEKLGATAGRYVVDMYGPRSDDLNRNAPTDRLIAVWETHPAERAETPAGLLPRLLLTTVRTDGSVEPSFGGLPPDAEGVVLEIPADIGRLRAEVPDLAGRWGEAVRRAFLAAFEAGYRAVGFRGDGYYLEKRGDQAPTGFAIQRE